MGRQPDTPSRPGPFGEPGATAATLLIVAAGFTALWLRFNPAAVPAAAQYPSDLLNYFYPHADYVGRRLASGELPLWNPHLCGGLPELALAQPAVLYPGTWLQALAPAARTLPLSMLVQCLLGGGFAALYLRALGLGAIPAGTGGLLYVATCMLGQTFWPPQVAVLLWLPWQLLCIERLIASLRWRWWVGLVAGSALQLLGGFPQLAAYSLLLLVPYAVVRASAIGGRAALTVAARIAIAFCLAAGVASAQLLPTWELVREGERSQALSERQVHYLGTVSSGRALRSAVDPSPKFRAFDFGGGGNYMGIATLVLFAIGAVCGPARVVVPLAGLGVLGLLLSDGYRGFAAGLYEWLAAVPVFGAFRTPERLRLLTLLATIVIASVGLDALGRGFAGLAAGRVRFALAFGTLAAVSVAALGEAGAAWRAGLSVLLIASGFAWRQRPNARLLIQFGLGIVIVTDVWNATGPHGPWRNFPNGWSENFHRMGFSVIDDERLTRLQIETGAQRVEVLGALPRQGAGPIGAVSRLHCYEPLAPRSWSLLQRRLAGLSPGWQQEPDELAALHDAASVARIVVARPRTDSDIDSLIAAYEHFAQIFHEHDGPIVGSPPPHTMEIIANEDALPRAYLVARAEIDTQANAIKRAVEGKLDLRSSVVLEQAPIGPASDSAWQARPAEIVLHEPERIVIDVVAPMPSWLVLTDAHFPGWNATVDAESTPVMRANGLFRAVRVPAGRHRVIFAYEPESLRWGFLVSIASLCATATLPIVWRWLISNTRDRGAAA